MQENCVRTDETVDIGRARNGQFAKGNTFAKGNPYTKRVAQFRRTILSSVTESDISAIVAALVFKAKNGDTSAAKLVLNYTVGSPQIFESPDLSIPIQATKARVDKLETQIKMIEFLRKYAATALAPTVSKIYSEFVQATTES